MAGIKIKLEGFTELLEDIQRANGDIDRATMQAINESAEIAETELRNACAAASVPSSITSEIRIKTEQSGNRYSAKVGWEMGAYHPRNPSAGHKAVFLNYGTPRRTVRTDEMRIDIGGGFRTMGTDRGSIAGRGFITKAKKKAKPKIKKAQEECLREILKGLQ